MNPTAARLVRIIPRAQLPPAVQASDSVVPALTRHPKPVTLIERLQQRQEAQGANWPSNIRLEPELGKRTFKNVRSEYREKFKKFLKEI
ncbi:hypothetical protein PUNSTDRAFT_70013 [Punctularia strigosozonata HHB-11173 SS5]|uniref:uncharacterized protein n=1 Tax=Punctularia strigosozonata (strain HHB-11173) TaxID=741275 RepID=UPI0004417768|nr:uncharacterized protein PUNSTDRAFT_70013 [Punctularia strigosozonata HHB-11173 SS5]EIN07698.1 hypothetical protein PUNSTDRAFT_70013 [Punctularia strigosozonata HHB-11173 SS5]